MIQIEVRGRNIDADALAAELEAALGESVELTVAAPEPIDLVTALPDPSAVQAVLDSFRPTEVRQLDQLIDKARRVWNGTDTFTVAQVQKILAGLVLLENRRR